MEITGNNLKRPRGFTLRFEQQNGLYTVTNAYEGEYEFFEDRPLPVTAKLSSESVEPAATVNGKYISEL